MVISPCWPPIFRSCGQTVGLLPLQWSTVISENGWPSTNTCCIKRCTHIGLMTLNYTLLVKKTTSTNTNTDSLSAQGMQYFLLRKEQLLQVIKWSNTFMWYLCRFCRHAGALVTIIMLTSEKVICNSQLVLMNVNVSRIWDNFSNPVYHDNCYFLRGLSWCYDDTTWTPAC